MTFCVRSLPKVAPKASVIHVVLYGGLYQCQKFPYCQQLPGKQDSLINQGGDGLGGRLSWQEDWALL